MAIADALSPAAGGPPRRGHLPAAPRRKLAVLTCMDARLDPLRDLGLDVGDAHVIRNAGGRATQDALRSLLISWHVLGTREVLVVHHTGCGLHVEKEGSLRALLVEQTGVSLDGVDLHTFSDPADAVRADVARIRNSSFAPAGLTVRGAIHDVSAGLITVIPEASQP